MVGRVAPNSAATRPTVLAHFPSRSRPDAETLFGPSGGWTNRPPVQKQDLVASRPEVAHEHP